MRLLNSFPQPALPESEVDHHIAFFLTIDQQKIPMSEITTSHFAKDEGKARPTLAGEESIGL